MTDDVRIHIPEELEGPWSHAVILTFNANLAFFESAISRKLGTARNRIILADDAMLAEAFAEAAQAHELRHVNAGYLASPIRKPGLAHAKLILLVAPQRGRLLVGSGNLTMSGYAGQGEQFTRYDRDDDVGDRHLAAFLTVKHLLDELVERAWVDEVAARHLQAVWSESPWIFGNPPTGPSPVRHNLQEPLLEQFVTALDGAPVDRLTVHAPYWDANCTALAQLLSRTNPSEVTVLLQPGETEVNGDALEAVLAQHGGPWAVRPVQAQKPTRLHAKFVLAEHGQRATCLQGSANLSVRGLTSTALQGNLELTNLLTGPRHAFASLIELLETSAPIHPASLPPTPEEKEETESPAAIRILHATWDGSQLTVTASQTSEGGQWQVLVVLDPVDDVEVDGATLTARPSPEVAERLDRGAHVTVTATLGGQPVTSLPIYPYRTRALQTLLTQRADEQSIRRVATLELRLDDDVEQLLQQLDDVLVIDRGALWKMTGKHPPAPAGDDGTSTLHLENLDWEHLSKHPKLARYRRIRSEDGPAGEVNELQILLAALAGRLGDLGEVHRPPSELPDDGPETTSAEVEPEEGGEDELARRQEELEQAIRDANVRRQRAFTRFVKRFTLGVTDREFADLVGVQYLALNVVVFNALVGRLIAKGLVDPKAAVEALLTTWEYLWGTHQDGYIHGLHEDDRNYFMTVFEEQDAYATVLAGIYRADEACLQGKQDGLRIRLRDIWRRLLVELDRSLTSRTVSLAANEATSAWVEPEQRLCDALYELAMLRTQPEIHDAIGAAFDTDHRDLTEAPVEVKRRGGGHKNQWELRIEGRAHPFDQERVAIALGTWARLEPEREYYRLQHLATRGRAVLDLTSGERWWAAGPYEDPNHLGRLPDTSEPWEKVLERLASSLAGEAA